MKRTFAQLIDAYGNASFEAGAWEEDDEESYETVHHRVQEARAELEKALRKAGLPIAAVAA